MREITMDKTQQNKTLNKHIRHNGGSKTVCASTCLNFFGIPDTAYKYTSSNRDVMAYARVLRRHGYSVRSRKSEFKATKYPTMTKLRANMKKSKYTSSDYFIVCGNQKKCAHLMVLDGNGKTIIDTAPKMMWKITQVAIVEKN